MHNQALEGAARILHAEYTHRTANLAPVTDLPATLSVERCGVQDHERLLWSADTLDHLTVDDQSHDLATTRDALVACEFGRAHLLEQFGQGLFILCLGESGCGAAALLLALHGLFK